MWWTWFIKQRIDAKHKTYSSFWHSIKHFIFLYFYFHTITSSYLCTYEFINSKILPKLSHRLCFSYNSKQFASTWLFSNRPLHLHLYPCYGIYLSEVTFLDSLMRFFLRNLNIFYLWYRRQIIVQFEAMSWHLSLGIERRLEETNINTCAMDS